jgi:hypothetical protein
VSSSSDVQHSAMTYSFSFLIYNVIQCDTHTIYLSQTRKLNTLVQSLFVLHTYINTYVNKQSVTELYKQTLKAVLTQCQTCINNLICFHKTLHMCQKHNNWGTLFPSPAMFAINKYMYAIQIGVLKHFYWH